MFDDDDDDDEKPSNPVVFCTYSTSQFGPAKLQAAPAYSIGQYSFSVSKF